jgi:uncharacterized protein YciI
MDQSMKHFLLEQHADSFKTCTSELITAQQQFLQQGYDEGRFLLSGPTIPPSGGILIARAESRERLRELLADERYCNADAMRFNRITEFDAVQHQFLLNNWFGKYAG